MVIGVNFFRTIRPSSPMWTIQNERTKYRKSPKDWNGQWVKSVNKILYSQLPFITHAGFRKILVRVRSLVWLYRSGEGCTRPRLYCMRYFVVTILELHVPEFNKRDKIQLFLWEHTSKVCFLKKSQKITKTAPDN